MRNVYRAHARASATREELVRRCIDDSGIDQNGNHGREWYSAAWIVNAATGGATTRKPKIIRGRSRIWFQTGGNKNVTHSQTWRAVAPEPVAGQRRTCRRRAVATGVYASRLRGW